MTFAPSGRFKLLDAPYASPGKCGLCGYAASGENEPADKRQYVDFNLDFEYYGALYFCTECLHSLISEMGYITPTEADDLKLRLMAAVDELSTFGRVVEVINGLANFLVDAGWISHSLPVPVGDESGPSEVSEESDSGEGSDDSEAAKSSDESGPDDTSDVGSDLTL